MKTPHTYTPAKDESVLEFVRRIIEHQPDHKPLHIVEHLVEIALNELKERPCQVCAETAEKQLTVTLHHNGKPIDERTVWVMGDHTDHVDYYPNGNEWVLTIRRDVPSLFIDK
ncbi:MAG: hypothetical protein J5924_00790 [Bacteroidaceae bacterium]|nr:hypothetical protein [Bacteroidaceae bacterium]